MVKFNRLTLNKNKKPNIKKILTKFFLLLMLIAATTNMTNNISAKEHVDPTQFLAVEAFVPLSKDRINTVHAKLLNEIQSYIFKHAPTSKIQSALFLIICHKYDFDIVLAMSQAHVESHYGTKGIASRTNSVFNVGTYDDAKPPVILYRYKDPNHSIEPYMSLMNRNYLRNNKTATDILKAWSFVDYKGDRYATFKYYEYRVRKVYKKITETTEIVGLYEIYTSNYYERSTQYYSDIEAIEKVNKNSYFHWNK